jgi:hypothetical protein
MQNSQQPNNESIVALAIEAVEGTPQPNPLDMDMRGIGGSPCDLDLPVEQLPGRKGVVPIRVSGGTDEHRGEMI